MAQLSIDTTTGRLTVADGGFADCSGLESIRQHVWLRLQIFLGELIPKRLALAHAEGIAIASARPRAHATTVASVRSPVSPSVSSIGLP